MNTWRVASQDVFGERAKFEEMASHCVSVLEGHALWAASYDSTPNPLLSLEERELAPLLPDLREKFVLDIGCGTGRWLRKLQQRRARKTAGLDLSPEMLSRASGKPSLCGRLIRGDSIALPIRNCVADLVICSFVVGYVVEFETLIKELARVLRPQGQVFVSDFHPAGYERGWRRTFRVGEEIVEMASFARPVAEICAEFEAAGFALKTRLEPCFGEPERFIFERGGRESLYDIAREEPAIFICEFERAARQAP